MRSPGDSSLGCRSGEGTEDGTGSLSKSCLDGKIFFIAWDSVII